MTLAAILALAQIVIILMLSLYAALAASAGAAERVLPLSCVCSVFVFVMTSLVVPSPLLINRIALSGLLFGAYLFVVNVIVCSALGALFAAAIGPMNVRGGAVLLLYNMIACMIWVLCLPTATRINANESPTGGTYGMFREMLAFLAGSQCVFALSIAVVDIVLSRTRPVEYLLMCLFIANMCGVGFRKLLSSEPLFLLAFLGSLVIVVVQILADIVIRQLLGSSSSMPSWKSGILQLSGLSFAIWVLFEIHKPRHCELDAPS